jgi:hypothetical protein
MARFDLRPGATIETVTPDELDTAITVALDARAVEDYTRRKDIITLDGNGAGSTVELVSPQYDWRIERVTLGGAGAAGALVQIYENQQNPMDLLEVIQLGTAGIYSDGFDNSLYVPAAAQIVIAVTGGVANRQVTYNLQIRQLHRRNK